MSILIKGMEIPKGCASCFLKYGSCSSIRKRMDISKGDRWCPENYRHPDCPLIEVPEDVQPVVRCKDCVYRPYYEPSDSKSVSDLVFPDYRFNPCPCRVEDIWYSWMPDDDWFCAYGKRNDGEA